MNNMFTQRATAYKTTIKNVLSSEYVNREGESDYIMLNGKEASRVRIMASIVNKFSNDERKSATIILDDGTDVISARGWEKEYDLLNKMSIGLLVDVIGRVRKYNDDVYLIPEIVRPVEPDWLVLRKIELKPPEEPETKKIEPGLKEKIIEKIKSKGNEGATMEELTLLAGDKTKCIDALRSLIEEDMIFEPRAGRYKLL